mgnify:CR=1 FL=1
MKHIITAIILIISIPVQAAETMPGPYEATPYSVYDGDTFRAHVRIWLGQTVSTPIRIDGIDTPEKRGKCEYEKALERVGSFKEKYLDALNEGPDSFGDEDARGIEKTGAVPEELLKNMDKSTALKNEYGKALEKADLLKQELIEFFQRYSLQKQTGA